MNLNRDSLRQRFVDSCNLNITKIDALAQDASFRRYFRLYTQSQSYILMDAPPDKEDVQPFVLVAKHLRTLQLTAPEIYHMDLTHGFLILEDFGDNTFTCLLRQGHDELSLYELALRQLTHLHSEPKADQIELDHYNSERLINEALLLCDWFYEKQHGVKLEATQRQAYIQCWNQIIQDLPRMPQTLVLRDYHVDNLIQLADGQCGLLDFQDAVIGSPAYDLVSLLEDARRDIPESIQKTILDAYFNYFDSIDRNAFMRWYQVLGAQRHCKVLGIFTRLSVRDGKHHYLKHLERVERLLKSHMDSPDLSPLKSWLKTNNLLI